MGQRVLVVTNGSFPIYGAGGIMMELRKGQDFAFVRFVRGGVLVLVHGSFVLVYTDSYKLYDQKEF